MANPSPFDVQGLSPPDDVTADRSAEAPTLLAPMPQAAARPAPPPLALVQPPPTPEPLGPLEPDPAQAAGGDPLIGQRVGSFDIVSKLGQGGMGAVYLGEHPTIGSRVAIKFLHPALASNPSVVRRFYAEARAANLASHEHIVRVLDLSFLPGRGYFLVMEYVEGETLSQRLGGRPQPLAFAGEILGQLCEALGQAHARGVVHRDLKPENVLVVEKRGGPFIKVMDFGIAKLREARISSGGTQEGMVLGTPEYMAPEQCEGRTVDARTDIYALGVIAFQLVTGRLPFEGRNVAQLLLAHLSATPPSPRALRPELPPAWEGVILRALSKSPDSRFPTVETFAAAIAEAGRAVVQASVPPAPAAGQVRAGTMVEVELVSGSPGWRLRALDLSRAGAFLCFPGTPPALMSRVTVQLSVHGVRTPVLAEVVRHVSAAEASAWQMEPGFAVQFVSPSAEVKAHLQALAAQPAPGPDGQPAPRPLVDARVQLIERYANVPGNHYELLGVAQDATRAEIAQAGKIITEQLTEAGASGLQLADAKKLEAAFQRVQNALRTLGSVKDRMAYDGTIGNYRSIARALAGGLSRALVEGEHARFVKEHPDIAVRVGILLARAKIARTRGNLAAALNEVNAALAIDPLNLALHDQRVALEKP